MTDNQKNRLRVYKQLGISPKRVLDIGAYEGKWAKGFLEIYPDSEILMIEANPKKSEILSTFQERNSKMSYLISLLGNEEKDIEYFTCTTGCEEGNSIYKEKSFFPFSSTVLPMRKLDNIINQDIEYDFIKLDCQGTEVDIMKGGTKIIEKAEMIILESQVQEWNIGAPFITDVLNFMDNLGFKLFDIIDFHYQQHGILLQADLTFLKKDHKLFNLEQLA